MALSRGATRESSKLIRCHHFLANSSLLNAAATLKPRPPFLLLVSLFHLSQRIFLSSTDPPKKNLAIILSISSHKDCGSLKHPIMQEGIDCTINEDFPSTLPQNLLLPPFHFLPHSRLQTGRPVILICQ